MASKKLKVSVGLDFTSDHMSIEKIREQIDAAVSAVKINLDPQSAKKFEAELRELGGILEKHLNPNTGKINAKNLVADLNNNENFLMIEKLGQRYAEVGVNGQQSFRKVANEADILNKKITSSNTVLEKMGTTLMNTIRWNISSSVVNAVTGEFQKMYYFAKDLDRTLTDIRIVSGQSADQMERFAIYANESAQALKVSTIEYAQAATIFFQQGLGEADVKKMTDGAVMASRITGTAVSEMVDLLTSTMNGYKLAADEVLTVTDKLAAVGATTASNFEELSTGMSKVASMANTAGITIDELNAQLATIISVTRESPESIGTSLKTIYGRMLMFKTDTKALMEDEDGELFGAPKVEAALQAYSKIAGKQISLFRTTADGRRELRDLGEVIEEIGDSWDDVTDKTAKFGVATALAGSRQQNRLIALFDSWDMYKEAVETSLNAEGTTLKQNAIYMESYEGRLKGLQAAKEELYMVLTDSDSMKGFISMLTKGVELVTSLTEAAGGLSAVIGILGASMSKTFATKFHEVGGLSGLIARKDIEAATQAEIDTKNKLLAINKVLGAEEANRLRNNLKGAQDSQKAHQTMFELMDKEAKLIQEIARIEESRLTAASKKDIYDNMDGESKRLMEESANLTTLKAAYEDLANAKLEAESLIQKAAKETGEVELAALNKSFDEVTARIDDAQARIDNIKAQVPDIEEKAQEHGRTAAFEKKRVGVASDELNKQFEKSQKILQTQRAIQTVMMVTPSVISAATDETKSYLDVLQSGLTMLVPMIPAIVGGIMQLPAAFAKAGAGASALSVIMSTSLGPIVAIGGAITVIGLAIKAANNATKTFAKSMKELEKASDELAEQEQAYEAIEQQLEQIKTRRKEIADIGKDDNTTDEEKEKLEEELALLDTKHEKLERELVIEEMLLQAAREKAEIVAKEAATATMSSDYSASFDEHGNYTKDQVTVAEELENATAAYVKADEQILKYREALAKLKADEESTAREIRRAQKDLDNATEARDKAAEHVSEYSAAIREIIADLENEEGTNKDLIESLEEYLDASADAIAETLGVGTALKEVSSATEDYGENISDVKDELEKLADSYDEVISRMNSYGAMLDELETAEGLSAKSKEDIINNYQHLIPFMHDEAALIEELMRLHEVEAEVARDAAVAKLIINEDFWNASIEGNAELIDKLNEFYGVDLKNSKSLAEAKGEIELQLLEQLIAAWGSYYGAVYKGIKAGKTTLDKEIGRAMAFGAWSDPGVRNGLLAIQDLLNTMENMNRSIAGISIDLSGLNFSNIGRKEISPTKKSGSGSSSKPRTEAPKYDYDKDLQALESFLVKYIKKRGELEKKAIDDWYKKEIEALDKIHKAKIDAYKEDLQRYKDVADEKIRLLNDTYDEENYYEELTKEKEEERRIQSQIDKLALDDSSRANDERRRLRELLAQQVEKIANMERSREKDLKIQAYRDAVTVKENEVNNLIDKENELYEDSKAKIEATKDIRLEVWEKSYDDAAVYAEASKAITSGLVKDFNGKMVSVKNAYVDFENRYGKGMGILGDKTKKEFLATIDRVNLGMKGLMQEAGYLGTSVTNAMNKGNTAASNLSSGISRVGTSARNATNDIKKLNAELDKTSKKTSPQIRSIGIGNQWLMSYDDGGKIDYTGLANVHGTPSKPEYVFNYPQFRDLAKYIAHERNRMPTVPTANAGWMGQGIKIGNLIEIKGDVTHDVLPLLEKEVDKGIVKLRNMIEKQVGSPSRI